VATCIAVLKRAIDLVPAPICDLSKSL
jgi:hypothetical protein